MVAVAEEDGMEAAVAGADTTEEAIMVAAGAMAMEATMEGLV
jgi:ABC-type hemin transport system substrate-binding protein